MIDNQQQEDDADGIVGKVYYRTDTREVLVGTDGEFARFKSNSQHLVGDIKTSMLTPAEFVTVTGDDTWVLADGRDLDNAPETTDSKYKEVKGTSIVPDLRGMFLRGKNNGRSDGNENPDGDLALGTYQADEFKEHNHSYDRANNFSGLLVGSSPTGFIVQGTTTGNAGGNETRAKNVTVNFYIKINE
jgi:hypothetical protein